MTFQDQDRYTSLRPAKSSPPLPKVLSCYKYTYILVDGRWMGLIGFLIKERTKNKRRYYIYKYFMVFNNMN
jgi:hypothetical protein